MPGSFAHSLHHLVDQLDLSASDARYRNDETGATAYAPSVLLKAVLLAYSQDQVSSRCIERAYREKVLFIALTGDAGTVAHLTLGVPAPGVNLAAFI